MQNTHNVLGFILSILHILAHLILTTNLGESTVIFFFFVSLSYFLKFKNDELGGIVIFKFEKIGKWDPQRIKILPEAT